MFAYYGLYKLIRFVGHFHSDTLATGMELESGTSNTMKKHNADAQMMGGGNNTGMMMKRGEVMMMGMGMGSNNITSSINLMNVMSQAIGSTYM